MNFDFYVLTGLLETECVKKKYEPRTSVPVAQLTSFFMSPTIIIDERVSASSLMFFHNRRTQTIISLIKFSSCPAIRRIGLSYEKISLGPGSERFTRKLMVNFAAGERTAIKPLLIYYFFILADKKGGPNLIKFASPVYLKFSASYNRWWASKKKKSGVIIAYENTAEVTVIVDTIVMDEYLWIILVFGEQNESVTYKVVCAFFFCARPFFMFKG